VSRLHLVEPGGEAPAGLRDRGIWFLLVAGPVLAVTGAGQHLPSPGLGVLPFLLGESSLYIGEGPRQWEDSPSGRAVRVLGREPFYPVVIWFVGYELGPFIGLFIALDALVAWAPPNLDPDVGLFGPKGGDVLPCFEGVFLPWSRFIGGHPSYCRLAVRQDGDQSESVVSCCRYLQGSREGRALGVIGFLAPAHMGLVAFQVWSFFQTTAYPVAPFSKRKATSQVSMIARDTLRGALIATAASRSPESQRPPSPSSARSESFHMFAFP